MDRIIQAWGQALDGKPVLVLVGGAADSGAARLLAEVALQPALAGHVVQVQLQPHEAALPMRMASRLLAEVLGEGVDLATFRSSEPSGMTPEHRRAVAFSSCNARLRARIKAEPLAIAIAGFQWVDEASLAWLASFCATLGESDRLLLILAGSDLEEAERLGAGSVELLRVEVEDSGGPSAEPGEAGYLVPETPREAAWYYLEAAEQSLAWVATRTAMEQIQQAAACFGGLGSEDGAWQIRLLDVRAAAHAAAGSLGAAILHSRQRLALGGPAADLCRAYDRHIGYLVKKGEPGQALTTCQEALARVPADTPGRTKLVARRAQSLLLAGRHQEALADCATCLAALEPEGDAHLAGFVYLLWGGIEIRRLDLMKARSALESALGHFQVAGDLYNQAITFSDLGTVHVRLGEAGSAGKCFDQGLQVAERIGDRRLRAVLLNNQGMLVHQQGETAQARSCFAQALAIHRDMDDQRSMGIALLNLGEVCLALDEREAADDYLSEALRVNEKIGAWDVMAETYRQIARLEGDRGDKRAALDAIKQGTQIAEQTGQIELQGVMLRLVAGLQADLANHAEALAAVAQSIEILQGIDAPLELGRSFAEQGSLLRRRGQVAAAAAALAQAEALFKRIDAQFELEHLRSAH